jgi:hypothetical protein
MTIFSPALCEYWVVIIASKVDSTSIYYSGVHIGREVKSQFEKKVNVSICENGPRPTSKERRESDEQSAVKNFIRKKN